MEEYMTKTREDYGLSIARPKINEKAHFELKCQFLKELRDNTFSGSNNEDANKHIEKGLEIVDLFHIPDVTQDMQEVILFYKGLDVPTRQILDSKDAIPTMKVADAKKAIKDMADHSKKWHNGTSTRTKGIDTSNGLAAIQAHLNNLRREIKKVNEKVYLLKRGSGSLLGSTETNLRDHVKSISITVETDTPSIHQKMALVELMYRKESTNNLKWLLMEKLRMGYQIEVSTNMHDSLILEDSLPTKEKDSGSLGELTPTKLIIILADRTMKHPKGIAENLLVEDLGPTIKEGEVIDEPMEDIVKTRNDDNEISDGIDELP
ncbi:hypothetical protein Tco_1557108 [Tanacetum coccineum]